MENTVVIEGYEKNGYRVWYGRVAKGPFTKFVTHAEDLLRHVILVHRETDYVEEAYDYYKDLVIKAREETLK